MMDATVSEQISLQHSISAACLPASQTTLDYRDLMAFSAKRRLSCGEGLIVSLQEATEISLESPLQSASEKECVRLQRSRKGRRRQRQAAFGSISMRGAPDACDAGWSAISPEHDYLP